MVHWSAVSPKRVAIIGGGIVGLSTARSVQAKWPDATVEVFDKEPDVAVHQTGRNSGVIHSGLYYTPGSMKALTCRAGRASLIDFADAHGVDFELCGKVVVALDDEERGRLDALIERGRANGVTLERLSRSELSEREPHVAGVAGIFVADTGIVDYVGMCRALAAQIVAHGGAIRTSCEVAGIERRNGGLGDPAVVLTAEDLEHPADALVNCAGLQSDRVARLTGVEIDAAIVPFRGEYYELRPEAEHLCRHLIYPVPDPRFPFLGVHLTRMIGGGVECGPNAVLALSREGYRWRDVDLGDLGEVLGSSSFRKLARTYWKTGAGEMWRSASKRAFVKALQRLVPELTVDDVTSAPSGVRAQALGPGGALLDDFVLAGEGPVVNVVNAPSPAATAALAIGDHVADRLAAQLS